MTPAWLLSVAMTLPMALPAFELKGLAGPDVTRASLAGKPAVVHFWASWCKGCAAIAPQIEDAVVAAGVKDALYVAVSLDEERATAEKGLESWAKTSKLDRRFAHDPTAAFAESLAARAMPTVLVVAPDGKVTLKLEGHLGAAQRKALIDHLQGGKR